MIAPPDPDMSMMIGNNGFTGDIASVQKQAIELANKSINKMSGDMSGLSF